MRSSAALSLMANLISCRLAFALGLALGQSCHVFYFDDW